MIRFRYLGSMAFLSAISVSSMQFLFFLCLFVFPPGNGHSQGRARPDAAHRKSTNQLHRQYHALSYSHRWSPFLSCYTAAFFLSSAIPRRFLPLLSYHGLTMVSRSILIPYPPGLRLGGRSDRYIKVIPRFPTKTRDLRIFPFPQPPTFAHSPYDKKTKPPWWPLSRPRGDSYMVSRDVHIISNAPVGLSSRSSNPAALPPCGSSLVFWKKTSRDLRINIFLPPQTFCCRHL